MIRGYRKTILKVTHTAYDRTVVKFKLEPSTLASFKKCLSFSGGYASKRPRPWAAMRGLVRGVFRAEAGQTRPASGLWV